MQNITEIQAQIIELQKQEKEMLAQQYKSALEKAQELLTTYKIPASDLTFFSEDGTSVKKARKSSLAATKKAKLKYRDENGNGWSGRGLKPKWLTAALADGKKIEDFLIAQEPSAE